ncbi:MAG: hypothetical protein GY786_12145 [Proteobacteria bacterium]|nr:hypothetical protein [Pseudomonadota bacterium]
MGKILFFLFVFYSFYSPVLVADETGKKDDLTQCPGTNATCWVANQNRFLIFKLEDSYFYRIFRNRDKSKLDISMILDNEHMKLENRGAKLRSNSGAIVFGRELMLEKNVNLESEITEGYYQKITPTKIEKTLWTLNGKPGRNSTDLAPIVFLDDRRQIRLCVKQQSPKKGQPGILIYLDDELLKMSNTETAVVKRGGCIDVEARKMLIGFKTEPALTSNYTLSGWFSVDLSTRKKEPEE